MTTPIYPGVTDELLAELEYAANLDSAIRITVRADYLRALLSEISRLRAENAELKWDAERYRWLREQCGMTEGGLTICKVGYCDLTGWSGDDPDAAIDAAMTT